MIKNTSRFLIAGLIIAWLVDFFFFNKPFGIAFSIWIFIAAGCLFLVSWLEKIRPHWLSILLTGITIAISTASFIRQEPFTLVVSALASLALLILITITFRNGNWPFFRLLDYIIQGLKWLVMIFSRGWPLIFQGQKKTKTENNTDSSEPVPQKNKTLWPVLRGLLLALPIILVLAALLAGADPIFEQGLNKFLEIFRIENLAEYVFRTSNILFMAYLFIGVLVQAIYPAKQDPRPHPNQPSIKKFLGSMETSIVFGSINLLFAAFLVIQFRYFFGGEANISETGFTYSEYARRGFGELITVAVLSLIIYYLFHSITRLESNNQKRRFSGLSILIFLQVLVMLVSSFQRLVLYENAYGFSRLRTYSHLFLPWLAVLIVFVIILEILQRQGHLAFTILAVAAGFVVTSIAFNIDGFIARQNIQRATLSEQEGYALDFYYISELSSDAVPVILDGFRTTTSPTRDLLGADLACRWHTMQNQETRPWQSFNLSFSRAKNLLEQNQKLWLQYPVEQDENGFQNFVMIDSETYYCAWADLFMD
ncbi:MAG: DUF4173 domain-containing protein [Anaerolineaceae bacterium]|nr:DUF4173 domain-containing protein [Anaerolineaceae bacterium]